MRHRNPATNEFIVQIRKGEVFLDRVRHSRNGALKSKTEVKLSTLFAFTLGLDRDHANECRKLLKEVNGKLLLRLHQH